MSSSRSDENKPALPTEELSATAKTIKTIGVGLKGAAEASGGLTPKLPEPVRVLADVYFATADAVTNDQVKTPTDIVCSGLGRTVQSTARGVLVTGVGLGVAAAAPTLDPVSRAVMGCTLSVAAQPMIDEITKPVGQSVEQACRITADLGEKVIKSAADYFKKDNKNEDDDNEYFEIENAQVKRTFKSEPSLDDLKKTEDSDSENDNTIYDIEHGQVKRIFKTAASFELPPQSEKQKAYYAQLKEKAAAATKAQAALNNFLKEQKEPAFSLTKETRVRLNEIAAPLQEFGVLGSEIATLATMCGGHARTIRGIKKASEGCFALGVGLSRIAASQSMMSLSAVTGMVGVAIGVMAIAAGLFGDNDDENGLAAEFQAVKEMIHAMHKDLLQIGRHLEQLITENMAVVIHRLNQVNAKLDRLERIYSVSMKELHSKELVDLIDTIRKDMTGEYKLADDKKRKSLRKLSTWMDCHSKASIQTSLLRESKDVTKCVEILGSDDFDIAAMFPFFIAQLTRILPLNLLGEIKIAELPNIALLNAVCLVYMHAMTRYGFDDDYQPSLTRAKNTFEATLKIVSDIERNEELLDILFRQYEHYRYQVGRTLEKCRAEFSVKPGVSLAQHLKTGTNTENLMLLLDELEMRRLFLTHLTNLCQLNPLMTIKIKALESKKEILDRHVSAYDAETANYLSFASQGKVAEFKRTLEMGAPLNTWDSWGQAIHYIARDNNADKDQRRHAAIALVHSLMKANDLQMQNGTRDGYGTWGYNVRPIQWILNCGLFELAVLYCANGDNISEYNSHNPFHDVKGMDFYNAFEWARRGDWNCIVQQELVREMNTETSLINGQALRKAYAFYKAVEAGFAVSADDVSHDCVLMLVAILGDLRPLHALGKLKADINRPLIPSKFTLLMLAVSCGQEAVVDCFIKLGANHTVKCDFISQEPSTLLFIAMLREQWMIANKIPLTFFMSTNEQRKKIRDGILNSTKPTNKIIIDPSFNKKSSTVTEIQKTVGQLQSAITSLSTSVKEAKTINAPDEDFIRVFKQAKLFSNLFFNQGKKLSETNKDFEQVIQDHQKNIATSIVAIDKMIAKGDTADVATLKDLSSNMNMLDAIFSSMLEGKYSLSNNVNLMLQELNQIIAKQTPKLSVNKGGTLFSKNDSDNDDDDKLRKVLRK